MRYNPLDAGILLSLRCYYWLFVVAVAVLVVVIVVAVSYTQLPSIVLHM